MLEMLVSTAILSNSSKKSLLALPQTPNQEPSMWKKMGMLVVHLSDSSQRANQCQTEILSTSWPVGQGKRYTQRYTDPIQATTEMGI